MCYRRQSGLTLPQFVVWALKTMSCFRLQVIRPQSSFSLRTVSTNLQTPWTSSRPTSTHCAIALEVGLLSGRATRCSCLTLRATQKHSLKAIQARSARCTPQTHNCLCQARGTPLQLSGTSQASSHCTSSRDTNTVSVCLELTKGRTSWPEAKMAFYGCGTKTSKSRKSRPMTTSSGKFSLLKA